MLRLPPLKSVSPKSLTEAAQVLSDAGPHAAILAGGTDLIPKLKRRQVKIDTLVSLRRVAGLTGITLEGRDLVIKAGTLLADFADDPRVGRFQALAQAAGAAATPAIRNQATLGGNLLLDTRCSFYDQTEHWRDALGHCLKTAAGGTCRVAAGSKRCFATNSGDLAPALIAHGARVRLRGVAGRREILLEELYADDGRRHLRKKRGEILTEVLVETGRTDSAYLKLRRREAFDFPALGVAVALTREGKLVRGCRIVLGGMGPAPVIAREASSLLNGSQPTEDLIAAAAAAAVRCAKPVNNTDFSASYRRRMVGVFVSRALKSLLLGGTR